MLISVNSIDLTCMDEAEYLRILDLASQLAPAFQVGEYDYVVHVHESLAFGRLEQRLHVIFNYSNPSAEYYCRLQIDDHPLKWTAWSIINMIVKSVLEIVLHLESFRNI